MTKLAGKAGDPPVYSEFFLLMGMVVEANDVQEGERRKREGKGSIFPFEQFKGQRRQMRWILVATLTTDGVGTTRGYGRCASRRSYRARRRSLLRDGFGQSE